MVEITYRESGSAMEMDTHWHNAYEMIYVTEGSVRFTLPGKTYEAGKGSLLFISNLEQHQVKVLRFPYKRYCILIKPQCLASLAEDPALVSVFKYRPRNFTHLLSLSPSDAGDFEGRVREMHGESLAKKAFWESAVISGFRLLLISLYRNHPSAFPVTAPVKAADMVFQAQKYIEEHCTEELSLSLVSGLFYTDRYYLSHLFRQVTGYTFKEYVILQRLAKAKDLLFYTSGSVTQVAAEAGFGNLNHFIRIFRKYTGTTPLQYRKIAHK